MRQIAYMLQHAITKMNDHIPFAAEGCYKGQFEMGQKQPDSSFDDGLCWMGKGVLLQKQMVEFVLDIENRDV